MYPSTFFWSVDCWCLLDTMLYSPVWKLLYEIGLTGAVCGAVAYETVPVIRRSPVQFLRVGREMSPLAS